MKRVSMLFALLLLLPAVTTVAQESGMKMFEGTWSQVLAEAQRQNKPIYLDAYASWCGPCKLLKREVFPQAAIGEYFNANYISYSLDMEKGEGIELRKKYDVRGYPTHLYFDPKGNLVHRTMGAGEGSEFVQRFITWAEDGRNPQKQYYTLKARFDAGERGQELLHDLAMAADVASVDESEMLSKAYFATQRQEDLYSEKNWNAIQMLVNSFRFKEYYFLQKQRDEFVKRYGRENVDAKILSVAVNSVARARSEVKHGQGIVEKQATTFTTITDPKEIQKTGATLLSFYRAMEDWGGYTSTAVRYIEVGMVDDAEALNEVAWTFYEHVEDPALLSKAESWARKAVDRNTNYAISDTYAAVLFKVGKLDEARKWAAKAIELGKAEKTDVAGTEELLAKIDARLSSGTKVGSK